MEKIKKSVLRQYVREIFSTTLEEATDPTKEGSSAVEDVLKFWVKPEAHKEIRALIVEIQKSSGDRQKNAIRNVISIVAFSVRK